MRVLIILISVFVYPIAPQAPAVEDAPQAPTVEDAPLATSTPFHGLVSHQRSMLSSRWHTLATPWFVVNDKNLTKAEMETRVKELGRTIDQLIAALTNDQLEVAENMGMVQVYLILSRFIKKYPSKSNEFVPDIGQEVFDKMTPEEQAATKPPKSVRSRRYMSSIPAENLRQY